MPSLAGTTTADESSILAWNQAIPDSYAIRFSDGAVEGHGNGSPAFTLVVKNRRQLEWLLKADAYSAALSFVRGEFDVQGDLVAAIRFRAGRGEWSWRGILHAAAARFAPRRIETWWQSRDRAARNIRQHYDRSNEFYKSFLDSRMVYSCAYYRHPDLSLDEAQLAKLDRICRKLDLRPGERFLDIGCGWGALLFHAAEHFGVHASGCTLSGNQAGYARELAASHPAGSKVTIEEADFRAVRGRFDKIASVGMFEHVGRRRLRGYFRKVYELLAPDGLFLNHGIVRPQFVGDSAQTLFLQRKVFPGGELAHLADLIRIAELTGFEVLDVEDLRPHYALTCRAWVERLQRNELACVKAAGEETYRTWLLYLAGSAHSFESGASSVTQTVLAKRKSPLRRLTRDYMCAPRMFGQPWPESQTRGEKVHQ